MIHHPDLGNVRYELAEVSDEPGEQVAQVIGIMRRYAVEDAQSAAVRDQAARVTAGSTSDAARAAAIFHYVRSRIRFTKDERIAAPLQTGTDIPIVEALVRPVDMAAMCEGGGCSRVGDCDDFAMYTAALLLAAGIPCAYVTVAADSRDPGRFSHVYVAAYTADAGRIALDTSHGEYPGWEASGVYERREWPLTGGLTGWWPALIAAALAWWAYGSGRGRIAWA